jgi:hypothetical protein
VVMCLPLEPRFAGSNTAENDGFLRAINFLSATSFEGEMSCRSYVVTFYSKLKLPTNMKEIFCRQNLTLISFPNFSCFATGCFC